MDDDEAQARGGADTPGAADAGCNGRNPNAAGDGAETDTATRGRTKAEVATQLMEQVVERGNMWRAYERVLRNKGAPGADGMRVQELKAWLQAHWPSVKAALLAGSYLPRQVRAVDIPKPSGGVRTLGVPTVVDRLIQQAVLQVLQPIFEGGFSQSSYGFRPGRNAWQPFRAGPQISPGIAHSPSRLCLSDLRRSIAVQVLGFDDMGRLTLLRRLYPLPVRQASALPSASFRFAVARNTLAVRLTVPLAGSVEDFRLQVSAPCRAHTTKKSGRSRPCPA